MAGVEGSFVYEETTMTRLEEHDGVLFEGDWLPLAGLSVFEAKSMLKDAWCISYFADAIVNGRQVPVAHPLRRGEWLEFVQGFGFKAGADLTAERAMAEALLRTEPELALLVDEVYELRLPVDKRLAIMALRVFQLCEKRFGRVTADAGVMLNKVANELSRLAGGGQTPVASRAERRPISHRVRVDVSGGEVVIDGVHHALGRTPLAILDCLVAANGDVVSRAQMRVRSKALEDEDHIERHIKRLKRNTKEVGRIIEVSRKGFRILGDF
jgi:hypothetical protein